MVLDSEGKPSRKIEAKPFTLEEMAPVRRKGSQPKEAGGFRLLVYGGRQEDPLERAQRQAKQVRQEAEEAAAQAVAQAKDQAGAIKDKAYQEGYEQGQKEGRQASKALVTAAADNLGRALTQLDQTRAQVMRGLEGEMLGLVQAVCDKVFMTPDAVPQQVLQNLVRQAVGRLLDFEKVTVRLAAKDLAAIEEFRPELLKRFSELGRLHLVTDENMGPGECVVESPTCQVDATLETRRQRVFQALSQALGQDQDLDLGQALAPEPAEPVEEQAPEPEADQEEPW